MAAIDGEEKINRGKCDCGAVSPGGPRQQAADLARLRHAKDESFLLRPAGDMP